MTHNPFLRQHSSTACYSPTSCSARYCNTSHISLDHHCHTSQRGVLQGIPTQQSTSPFTHSRTLKGGFRSCGVPTHLQERLQNNGYFPLSFYLCGIPTNQYSSAIPLQLLQLLIPPSNLSSGMGLRVEGDLVDLSD